VASILGNPAIAGEREAGRPQGRGRLRAAARRVAKLADAYERNSRAHHQLHRVGSLILAAIAVIALIVLVVLGDTRRRAEEAERQRAETSAQQSNQDAILD